MLFLKGLVRRKLFWLALIYFPLLVWSGFYRFNTPPPEVPQNRKMIALREVDGDRIGTRRVNVAYREFRPKGNEGKGFPVVAIHGSPGDADVFQGLAGLLPDRRIVSVDLPGFGYSEMNVPDYSIKAHSVYLSQLLDELEITNAHLVGFSLGGGVIEELENRRPDLVASVTFISSIGVQEYELFGDYYVNHAVHGLQLSFFWGLMELVPHFGVLDGPAYSYARNFYDTDQRPLRGILESTEKPFLIVHGRDDPLVPVEAAREHSRIVPQSEYHELDDDHFYIFLRPEKAAPLVGEFFERVEAGTAATRSKADPGRKLAAALPFEMMMFRARGAAAFCLLLLIAGLAIWNQDAAFVIAAVLAAQGRTGLILPIVALTLGILVSSVFRHRRKARPARLESEGGTFRSYLFEPLAFGFYTRVYSSGGLPFPKRLWLIFVSFVAASLRGTVIFAASYGLCRLVIASGAAAETSTDLQLASALSAYIAAALLAARLSRSKKGTSTLSGIEN